MKTYLIIILSLATFFSKGQSFSKKINTKVSLIRNITDSTTIFIGTDESDTSGKVCYVGLLNGAMQLTLQKKMQLNFQFEVLDISVENEFAYIYARTSNSSIWNLQNGKANFILMKLDVINLCLNWIRLYLPDSLAQNCTNSLPSQNVWVSNNRIFIAPLVSDNSGYMRNAIVVLDTSGNIMKGNLYEVSNWNQPFIYTSQNDSSIQVISDDFKMETDALSDSMLVAYNYSTNLFLSSNEWSVIFATIKDLYSNSVYSFYETFKQYPYNHPGITIVKTNADSIEWSFNYDIQGMKDLAIKNIYCLPDTTITILAELINGSVKSTVLFKINSNGQIIKSTTIQSSLSKTSLTKTIHSAKPLFVSNYSFNETYFLQFENDGNVFCDSLSRSPFSLIKKDISIHKTNLPSVITTSINFTVYDYTPNIYITSNMVLLDDCLPNLEGLNSKQNVSQIINLFPNPNLGKFSIDIQGHKSPVSINVYNLLGEEVYKSNFNSSTMQFDFSYLSKGIYLVKINSIEISETRKIIIE